MSLKLGLLGAALVVLPACKDDKPKGGELVVQAMIGPEGGELVGNGITLTVPPMAVTSEMLFELRTSAENLSAGTYRQQGGAFELFPESLRLRLPAQLTFTTGPDAPAVLFEQDGMTVAGNGLTTYINELGVIAIAEAGIALTNATEPAFFPTPESATTTIPDRVPFALQITDTPTINVVMTLYDFTGAHLQDLNGTSSEGDCGFAIENVSGASLSAGCTEGPITASLRSTNPEVTFEAAPFQAGRVSPAVPVGVIAGGTDLAYFLGFFSYETTACFEETCNSRGTCQVNAAGEPGCVCDDGFMPNPTNPLGCVCAPDCTGRECGDDGCGGSCGDCGDGRECNFDAGMCFTPDDPSTGGPDTDTEGDTDPGSTGEDTTGGMTDDSGSTGDGSSSGGGSTTMMGG